MHPDNAAEWEALYPFAAHIGMELVEWRADYARLQLPLVDFTKNRHGAPHGGVHASLLDSSMGFAGCFTGDPDDVRLCLTLNLSVNYLSRPEGKLFIAEGHRTGGGKRTFFAEGSVRDETGVLVATATGVFRYRG